MAQQKGLLFTLGCVVLVETVSKWLELLVSIEVALEVLKQDYFLVDTLRVVKEIVMLDHVVCRGCTSFCR